MVRAQPIEVDMPAAASRLRLLDRVDYQDAFRVDTTVVCTPERWMRTLIEGAPHWFRLPWVHLLGKALLRAEIGPMDGTKHVLGWKVLINRPDAFAVGLDSPNGLIRLITVTPPGRAAFATQIRFDTARFRVFWPAIRPGHRYFAPDLLRRACQSINSTGDIAPDIASPQGEPG